MPRQQSPSDTVPVRNGPPALALAGLRRAPAREATPVAWRPPNGHMEHPEWVAAGRRMGRISRCNQWWLGDWLRYGSTKWGEKYVEAARITGYDVRSLANMASIAASFDMSRRRDSLTWSHHAVVAALELEEQDRWLDRAIAERLSVSDLRIELRSAERSIAKAAERKLALSATQTAELTCPQCGYKLVQRVMNATAPGG